MCFITSAVVSLIYFSLNSGKVQLREDKPNLYHLAELTGQHTQTFNIYCYTKAINEFVRPLWSPIQALS